MKRVSVLKFFLVTVILLLMASPAFASNWTGTWNTNYGKLVMERDGDWVIGAYEHNKGKLVGVIKGNTLVGTWSEAPSYNKPDNAGEFEFIISADGKTFSGKWRRGSSVDWISDWKGVRVAGPQKFEDSKVWPQNYVAITSQPLIAPGHQITVVFHNAPGNPGDWITISKVGEPAGDYSFHYEYTEGKKDGTITFAGPVEPGEYEARLYAESSDKVIIGRSNVITVANY